MMRMQSFFGVKIQLSFLRGPQAHFLCLRLFCIPLKFSLSIEKPQLHIWPNLLLIWRMCCRLFWWFGFVLIYVCIFMFCILYLCISEKFSLFIEKPQLHIWPDLFPIWCIVLPAILVIYRSDKSLRSLLLTISSSTPPLPFSKTNIADTLHQPAFSPSFYHFKHN